MAGGQGSLSVPPKGKELYLGNAGTAARFLATVCTLVQRSPNDTADWERVGDRFYRKTQLYSDVFDIELELENYIVTGAPYSGAVGMHEVLLLVDYANGYSAPSR